MSEELKQADTKEQAVKKMGRKDRLYEIIKLLEISNVKKTILRERWADQTAWYGKKAGEAKKKRNFYRTVVIVVGALLPAIPTLANFLVDTFGIPDFGEITMSILSIIIALMAGLEAFFDPHDEYNRYRETAELMKIEGWSYFSLSGNYKRAASHETAYEKFNENVEEIIRREVKAFVASQAEKDPSKDEPQPGTPGP